MTSSALAQTDHLAWIADALGAPPNVVASAERNGDLLALAVAAGVRHLRGQRTAIGDLDAHWLADLLRAARAVMGDRDFWARDLLEAAQMPIGSKYRALAEVLCRIGDGQCPSPAVLGKRLREVVGTPADGLVLQLTARTGNTQRFAIEGA